MSRALVSIGYLSKSINGQKDGGDNLCTPLAVLTQGEMVTIGSTLLLSIRGLNYIHIEA